MRYGTHALSACQVTIWTKFWSKCGRFGQSAMEPCNDNGAAQKITPAGGGGPAGVIWDDWQLGGGVLPIVSRRHWEEECDAANSFSAGTRFLPGQIRHHAGRLTLAASPCLAPVAAFIRCALGFKASIRCRFDDCNIVRQMRFVHCNISMDVMRKLHGGIGRLKSSV